MSSLCIFVWLCVYFLIIQYNVLHVRSDWPSSNWSKIQLLGLFPEILTNFSVHSRAMFKSAIILSHEYNLTIDGEFVGYESVLTGRDDMDVLIGTCSLMSNSNVVGIVGPGFSRECQLIGPFAGKIGIPVISYGATDPELSDRNSYPTFSRTISSDSITALSIVNLFLKYNWTSSIIIYQNDAFGSGGYKSISEAFNKNNLLISEMLIFDISKLSIQVDLKSILTVSSTRIVLVWAEPLYTMKILENAIDSDVIGPQFTWILTSTVPLNNFNLSCYHKLRGMILIEPVVGNVVNAPINLTLLNAAYNIWQKYEPESFPGYDNVDNYALFAFDATWLLIQSLKQLCSSTINNSRPSLSFLNSSFCFDRRFQNSSSFLDIINKNSLLGVSGPLEFSINKTDRINGSYYIAKNIQNCSSNGLTYVPVLIWSHSHGWISHRHNIIWPGDSLIPPTSYATVSGLTLRIGIVKLSPFTMVKGVKDKCGENFFGYIPDLIELLRKKMGFIPNISLISSNETYNGIIDLIGNGVYDIVVADMTITSLRREKVAFSSSIFDNSLRIIMRETSTNDLDLFSYLRPFSVKLWLTLLIAIIYASLLLCILEREENEALINRSISSLIGMCMWYSIGTIVGYGADFHVRTGGGRLLTVGLHILSLVLGAAYTANLASELLLSKSSGIISGFDDIKNGKISFNRIGIIRNSSVEDYYLREISGDKQNFYPLKSEEEIYNNLLNNIIDVSIMDSGVLEYLTNNIYCNLTLIGSDVDKSAFGIVFNKKWIYQQELDVNILLLREKGDLDYLKRKWFETNFCSRLSKRSNSMSIESMVGLFLTFGVISILSLLLFIWIKRFIIKDYLFKLAHRNNFSVQ